MDFGHLGIWALVGYCTVASPGGRGWGSWGNLGDGSLPSGIWGRSPHKLKGTTLHFVRRISFMNAYIVPFIRHIHRLRHAFGGSCPSLLPRGNANAIVHHAYSYTSVTLNIAEYIKTVSVTVSSPTMTSDIGSRVSSSLGECSSVSVLSLYVPPNWLNAVARHRSNNWKKRSVLEKVAFHRCLQQQQIRKIIIAATY